MELKKGIEVMWNKREADYQRETVRCGWRRLIKREDYYKSCVCVCVWGEDRIDVQIDVGYVRYWQVSVAIFYVKYAPSAVHVTRKLSEA